MPYRLPYFAYLEGQSPKLAILLGLLARLRELTTGELPDRERWIADFGAYLQSKEQSASRARDIFDKFFQQKTQQDIKAKWGESKDSLLVAQFIDHCLNGGLSELDAVKPLLDRLTREPNATERLIRKGREAQASVASFYAGVAGGPVDQGPPWASGLRTLSFEGARTGFLGYPPARGNTAGLYLLVREARGWSTASAKTPPMVVRDLLWIRDGSPSDALPEKEQKAVTAYGLRYSGFYISSYNDSIYGIERCSVSRKWIRLEGSVLRQHPGDKDRPQVEISIPGFEEPHVDTPFLGFMTAHSKDGDRAGGWKVLLTRASDWPDADRLESEIEMFQVDRHETPSADVLRAISHFKQRRVIGSFEDEACHELFQRLVSPTQPDAAHMHLSSLAPSGTKDPLRALAEQWHRVEATQMILPSVDNAALEPEKAAQARDALFARDALGADSIEETRKQLAELFKAQLPPFEPAAAG